MCIFQINNTLSQDLNKSSVLYVFICNDFFAFFSLFRFFYFILFSFRFVFFFFFFFLIFWIRNCFYFFSFAKSKVSFYEPWYVWLILPLLMFSFFRGWTWASVRKFTTWPCERITLMPAKNATISTTLTWVSYSSLLSNSALANDDSRGKSRPKRAEVLGRVGPDSRSTSRPLDCDC